jgi:hypothetical protein
MAPGLLSGVSGDFGTSPFLSSSRASHGSPSLRYGLLESKHNGPSRDYFAGCGMPGIQARAAEAKPIDGQPTATVPVRILMGLVKRSRFEGSSRWAMAQTADQFPCFALSTGGGRLRPESVVALDRIGWPLSADRSHERVTRRPGKTLSFGNVAAAVRETSDISICSSRAQAGDQMALEPEDVPDRDGFSCFSGVVRGLQEAHDLRRSSPAGNGARRGSRRRRAKFPDPSIEGRKPVAKSRPRSQFPKRHRGHRNAGSPRRLIDLVTQSPA